jgi:putative restriction endonuclease
MARTDLWTRDQLLLALRLYMRLPFGKLHRLNPEIIELANQIGRTPNAMAMKACNFATLDPALQARGIRGLPNLSNADREIWAEFLNNTEALAAEAEEAAARIIGVEEQALPELRIPDCPTEVDRIVRARRVQSFFRAAVLTTYECRCALSGIAGAELLTASHIIPWSESIERRADPRNGLCLNALLDRAFDRGLFTFDDSLRVIVSRRLINSLTDARLKCSLDQIEGIELQAPTRFLPDPEAIGFHRSMVFQA